VGFRAVERVGMMFMSTQTQEMTAAVKEAFREAILASQSLPQWTWRSYVVGGFANTVAHGASEEDIKLLRKLGRGRCGDATHVRASALLAAGKATKNRADAARLYCECLALRAPFPVQRVFCHDASFETNVSVYEKVLGTVKEDLRKLRVPDDFETARNRHSRLTSTESSRKKLGNFAENALRLSESTACDQCGKTADGVSEKKFQTCSVCRSRYYCSFECSKAAWVGGHKRCCRAAGQFQIGDIAQLRALKTRGELNGQLVRVLEDKVVKDDGSERYLVCVLRSEPNADCKFKAKSENLLYLPKERRFGDFGGRMLFRDADHIEEFLSSF